MTGRVDIPTLRLEQYALGELSETQRQDLEARFGREVLLERVAEIRASNADILKRMPPRRFAAAVGQHHTPSQMRLWMVAVPVLALLTAVVVVPRLVATSGPDDVEITRQKGVPGLHVYKQRAAGPEHLERGDVATEGDVLQLSYAGAGAEFGAVVSMDGNQQITWHLPRHGTRAVRLNTGTVPLDHSYQLDDAPDFERFVFITASSPFSLNDIERALEGWDGGELHLAPNLSASVFDVDKAAP